MRKLIDHVDHKGNVTLCLNEEDEFHNHALV